MKWILYCTTCVVNHKTYIGVHKTENPDVFDSYIGCGVKINNPSSYMNPTTPFQAAVKKYGTKAFERVVLKVFDNKQDAYAEEEKIVNRDFIKRKDTYNAHVGGLGGGVIKTVYQFDLQGNLIKEWDAVIDASDFYGVSHTAILNACNFNHVSKGYIWSWNTTVDITQYNPIQRTPCYKYNAETLKYEDSYPSLPECAKANDIRLMVLERGVKGGYKIGDSYYSTTMSETFELRQKVSLKNKILYVYDLGGKFVSELKNSSEIYNFFNIKSTSSITTAMRTGRQYRNYQLSLEKVDSLEPIVDKRNHSVKIGRYSLTGDLLETFDSITAASKVYGPGVVRAIRGQQQQCKGFIFRKV